MAAGNGEQIEKGQCRRKKSHKFDKKIKHRKERRAAKYDPETAPLYNKYTGYEM